MKRHPREYTSWIGHATCLLHKAAKDSVSDPQQGCKKKANKTELNNNDQSWHRAKSEGIAKEKGKLVNNGQKKVQRREVACIVINEAYCDYSYWSSEASLEGLSSCYVDSWDQVGEEKQNSNIGL